MWLRKAVFWHILSFHSFVEDFLSLFPKGFFFNRMVEGEIKLLWENKLLFHFFFLTIFSVLVFVLCTF